MAIKIKPKKKTTLKLPSSFVVLFYYSIILLLFSASTYLLVSQWHIQMKAQIEKTEETIQRINKESSFVADKNLVFENRNKINDYSYLLLERNLADNFFVFLEKSTHPMAQLDSVRVNFSEGEVIVNGYAFDFYSLEQQYTIYKNFIMNREFSGWVKLNDVDIDEDGKVLNPKRGSVEIFKSPATNERKTSINRDDVTLEVLKEIQKEKYSFENTRLGGSLIEEDWYEVLIIEEINPIKNVDLVNVSETTDRDLSIRFEFRIKINPIIFKI